MCFRIGLIFIIILLSFGCSPASMAVQMALPLVQGQYLSMQEESDPEFAQRAIPANLKMMEGLLKSDPNNAVILNNLAEGFCSYSFSFVEDSDPERASDLYLRGRNYASRSLAVVTGIPDLPATPVPDFPTTVKRVDSSAIPELFWLGQCWSGWLMLNLDNPEAFADISKVEALMVRVLELNPSFHYAGPHIVLGAFYGSRTKLLGGNPEKSRHHFEQALEITENRYLLTYILFARTYAVQMQDMKLYEDLLQTVLDADPDVLPKQRLANEVAKIKADRLLGITDELF